MNKNQKLTGVVIDGVVYKVEKLDKKTCPCDTCDIVDFCQKEQHVQSLCYFYLPKYANFKKEHTMSDTQKYKIIYTFAKPLYAVIEATSKEEALEKFEAKMSGNPTITITIRSELSGVIEIKVKKVSKI